MKLETLYLKSFRCYDTFSLSAHPTLNIIVGNNAQGKTTILEAIHMLGLTKSHKLTKDTDLIQKDKEFAKIVGQFDLNTTKVELSMILSKSGKKAKYNKIEVSKLSEYIGRFNVVMFAPEDLELVKGSPQIRRRFLDIEIGQISKAYVSNLNHYRRLLKERNEVLKALGQNKKYDKTILGVLTDQLVHYAEKIIDARKAFIDYLNDKTKEIYPTLSEENPNLIIKYRPSVQTDFKQAYKDKESIDIMLKATQLGPHRDDIEFLFGNNTVKTFASQGQIRSVVLALKLAVAEYIYIHRKTYPIMLLDDVFSELDTNRQQRILRYIQEDAQVFITTTHVEHIDFTKVKQYKIVTIDSGRLKGDELHG